MDVIRLRVNLKHVEPKVMRSLLVPLNIQLQDLHITLQTAFGWTNTHYYSFETRRTSWIEPQLATGDNFLNQEYFVENYDLRDFLIITNAKQFLYIYDFGDYWEHVIHAGTIQKAKAGELYPKLTTVKGRCPPEDVGGPWGYEEFVEIMADKNHVDYEEYAEWHLGEFDINDTSEDLRRKSVEKVATLISKGESARGYFRYHPTDFP